MKTFLFIFLFPPFLAVAQVKTQVVELPDRVFVEVITSALPVTLDSTMFRNAAVFDSGRSEFVDHRMLVNPKKFRSESAGFLFHGKYFRLNNKDTVDKGRYEYGVPVGDHVSTWYEQGKPNMLKRYQNGWLVYKWVNDVGYTMNDDRWLIYEMFFPKEKKYRYDYGEDLERKGITIRITDPKTKKLIAIKKSPYRRWEAIVPLTQAQLIDTLVKISKQDFPKDFQLIPKFTGKNANDTLAVGDLRFFGVKGTGVYFSQNARSFGLHSFIVDMKQLKQPYITGDWYLMPGRSLYDMLSRNGEVERIQIARGVKDGVYRLYFYMGDLEFYSAPLTDRQVNSILSFKSDKGNSFFEEKEFMKVLTVAKSITAAYAYRWLQADEVPDNEILDDLP